MENAAVLNLAKGFLHKQIKQEIFATTSMPNPNEVVWQKKEKEQIQWSPTTPAKMLPLLNQNNFSVE